MALIWPVIALPGQGGLSCPLSVRTGRREGNRDSWADHATMAGFRRGGRVGWPGEHTASQCTSKGPHLETKAHPFVSPENLLAGLADQRSSLLTPPAAQ